MTYRYIEHPADIGFIAEGSTLEEAMEEAGRALFNIITDIKNIEAKEVRKFSVESDDVYKLLYDFLTRLLFYFDTEFLVFSDFKVNLSRKNGYRADVEASGEVFDSEKHEIDTGVKAITYHMMEILEDDIFKVRVIVDV
ncbi:MAG: archease [Candidatus Hydrothermarchaeota archaeon]